MVLCGRRVTGFGLACWLWVVALSAVTIAEQVWSPWYNSSPGPVETIENETLDRIAMFNQLPCGVEGVVAVQCRVAGSNVTFSGQGRHGGNVLHVPCNLTGLLCRPEDQVAADGDGGPCADYELRVLCLIHDEGSRPRPSDNSDNNNMEGANNMGIKGGFTALVAGASVVIPLACVLVFQLRKYKREERQRQRQARQAAEDLARANEAARATDAPPAYEELFGSPPPATGPLSVISSGVLLEDPASQEEAEARRSGTERLLLPGSFPERLEGRINPGANLDVPESARTGASPTVRLTSSSPPSVSGGSSPNAGPTGPSPSSGSTVSTSVSSSVSSARLSSVSSSSSSTSTEVFLPPGSSSRGMSGSDDTHPGPPPAYDWPGPAQHVTIAVPEGGSGTSGRLQSSGALISAVSPPAPVVVSPQPASSGEAPGRRRFLGMHLSIFDLMAAIYPDPASTPPPTYDDALKILEASKQHQVHVT